MLKSAERVILPGWGWVVDLAIFADALGAAETALEAGFVTAADLVKMGLWVSDLAVIWGLRLGICCV